MIARAGARLVAAAISLAASTAGADGGGDRARAARAERSLVVLATMGASFTLGDHRVANNAPPTVELRLGLRPARSPWAVVELGLGLIAHPEAVPSVSAGVRVHPAGDIPGARHLFVRAGAVGLGVIDGFDLAFTGEVGAAVRAQRLIGWLGVGADRFVVGPRLLVQGRVGVGFTF